MATFSPDTTVKETVNVNYHDRITGQKVVMINRENEFYGTFKGVAELSGTTLVNPTIEGGTLHGTKIVDDEGKAVNLSDYAQSIVDLEQADEDIRREFAEADNSLYRRIKSEAGEMSGGAAKDACDALSVELVGKMELADETLRSELEAHTSLSEEKFTSVEDRLTESTARIDIVDGKAEENKASITELEETVKNIKSASVGGLVYRGSVNIESDTETFGDIIESLEGSGEVKTGYMYSVVSTVDAPEKIEGKKVDSGDMIILKNITDTKTASDIRKINIEVIDAMDKTVIQKIDNAMAKMSEIESTMGGMEGTLATKEEVNTVRTGLQTAYQNLHDEIVGVRNNLNDSFGHVSDRIDGIDARIDNVHDELQTKVDEAAIISEANERRSADDTLRSSITGIQSTVTALDDRVDSVESGLETETARATGVESTLDVRITEEESRATTKEGELETAIGAEAERAATAESGLASDIAGVRSDLTEEVERATTKETEIATSVSNEKTRAEGVEADIRDELDTAKTELETSIETEKTRAELAESELESLLNAEQTARETKDIELGNRMSDMYSDLTGYIDEEALTRKTADEELDAKFDLALTTEIENRQKGDTEIKHDLIGSMKYVGHITLSCDDSGTPTQTLREMFHDYIENSLNVDPDTYPLKNGWIYQITIDTELTGQSLATLRVGDGTDDSFQIWDRDYIVIHKRENMTDLTSNYDPSVLWNELSRENIDIIDAMDDNVVVEEQLAEAIANLSIAIESEKTRATTKETEIATSVSNEKTRAEAKEAEIVEAIASAKSELEGSIGSLETSLTESINGEATRATGAESVLDGKITAEAERATTKEGELEAAIGAEAERAATAESGLAQQIEEEAQTREGDDDYLSGRIDGLLDNFKYYEAERYTAYEVMPTKVVIHAGTDLSANVNLGDGVISSLIDVTRCEEDFNLSGLITMQLPTDIPAGMTETFQLRCIPAYIEDTRALGIWVDWGDGSITNISDEGVVTNDSPRQDASKIGYTLAHFTHTYTTPGKYIVEIHGKGYYGVLRKESLTSDSTVDTLMSRVLDYDLPLSRDVTNFTDLSRGAKRLIYVRLPSHVNWLEGVQNASSGFANCTNLIIAKGFFNLMWHARISSFFSGCTNLKKCDLRLNGYPTYKNKLSDGNISVFKNCEKLEGDIAEFLPVEGFAARVVDMDSCFYHCKSLGFDSLSCGYNTGANNTIWLGTATTPKILWGDTSKLWKTLTVFGNNTEDIKAHMPNLSGYVDLIPTKWGGTKPDNMAIDEAAAEVLATIADYELNPTGYTMDDFVGLLSSFMDKIC